jgi:hypothetical protein
MAQLTLFLSSSPSPPGIIWATGQCPADVTLTLKDNAGTVLATVTIPQGPGGLYSAPFTVASPGTYSVTAVGANQKEKRRSITVPPAGGPPPP